MHTKSNNDIHARYFRKPAYFTTNHFVTIEGELCVRTLRKQNDYFITYHKFGRSSKFQSSSFIIIQTVLSTYPLCIVSFCDHSNDDVSRLRQIFALSSFRIASSI